jgi:hypothetical protein
VADDSASTIALSVDETGALRVAGAEDLDRVATLRFTPPGLEVSAAAGAPVVLPWDRYGDIATALDGPDRDGWLIVHWSTARRAVHGLGVRVSGASERAAADLVRATSGLRRRVQSSVAVDLTGRTIPVVTATRAARRRADRVERPEVVALSMVCEAARDHPDVRARLADAQRVRRLVLDLSRALEHELAEIEPRHIAALTD